MTLKQRFRQTMAFGRPDRIPLFDEGFRDDVLEQWRAEESPDLEPSRHFQYDRRLVLQPELYPATGPRTRADLQQYRTSLNADDPARLPSQLADEPENLRGDAIIGLAVHIGLFQAMGVGDWSTLKDFLLLLGDDPNLVREAMEIYARFAASLADHSLRQVPVDYACFSEPIGATHGPLISPRLYRDVALQTYRPIIDTLQSHGVKTIVFTTYGNAKPLLHDVLQAGFNTLWVVEAESPDMDYAALRREYGRHLCLIGGIDLDALTRGPRAIDEEIMGKVPPLLRQGGYIPLADGRVRRTVSFSNYSYYRRLLEHLVTGTT